MTTIAPTNFATPLSGNETIRAFGVSPNGYPCSQDFLLTTGQIAALADLETPIVTGIAANSGGVQAGATLLTLGAFNNITTVAGSNYSVALPASFVGAQAIVSNQGANTAKIFGTSPDTINGVATATGITIPAGAIFTFTCAVAGNWLQSVQTGGAFTRTFDGVLGGNTPAAAHVTTLSTTGAVTGVTTLTASGAIVGVGTTIGGIATGSYSQASNTTLANVTGLVATVVAGGTYIVSGYLATTNNGTGGIKLSLGGTATATTFVADTWVYNTTTVTAEANVSSLGSLYSGAVAATAVDINGTLVVNAGGTVQLQAAQNTSNGTPLTIANGSYLTFTRIA